MYNLTKLLQDQRKLEEAEDIGQQTLELKKKVLGIYHIDTINSMSDLAIILRDQGNYVEAEKMERQTLELKENALGIHHQDTYSIGTNSIESSVSRARPQRQSNYRDRKLP